MFKPNYYQDHGIADLTDTETGMAVRTMLPDPSRETASVQAYIGARFSRSDKSLVALAEETKVKGKAPERLEKIFEGYRHRSVGDQARIMVTLEGIPDLEAMYLLYLLPDYAAQQRSTRYQDFSNPHYLVPPDYKEIYCKLFEEALAAYKEAYDQIAETLLKQYPDAPAKTIEARALDEVRDLLPAGIGTNLAIYASARVMSEAIAQLRGSYFSVRRRIGELLYHLLKGTYHSDAYTAEAWRLIRHTEPKSEPEEIRRNIVPRIGDIYTRETNEGPLVNKTMEINGENYSSAVSEMIRRCAALFAPNPKLSCSINNTDFKRFIESTLAEEVFRHDDKTPLGNFAQVGAIRFEGLSKIGTLRDINRHRSTERFFPFLETATIVSDLTFISGDLDNFTGFSDNVINGYKQAIEGTTTDVRHFWKNWQKWLKHFKGEELDWYKFSEISGYAKYLLPLGTPTRYFVSCSPEDLTYISHVRTRPGGHLDYRRLVRSWVETLVEQEPFYRPLLDHLPEINPEEDFYLR